MKKKLTVRQEEEFIKLLAEEEHYAKFNKLQLFFGNEDYRAPDGTIYYARDKYPRFVEFFAVGRSVLQRAIISGNRCGKTTAGVYELVLHATGLYPDWWEGRRFTKPVNWWCCGDRGEAIRDSIQPKLLGNSIAEAGTGMIPKDLIMKTAQLPGIPNAVGQYHIKHKSGGTSVITIKTYQSGRTAFEGATIDGCLLDEECPRDVFSEVLTRTMTTRGIVMLTFTPDSGVTDTYSYFMDKSDGVSKHVVTVGWQDVPHIPLDMQKALLASYSPQERECRSMGTPYLGSGKIYQIVEDAFVIDPLPLPPYWPRFAGFDVGYTNASAAVYCAWDREGDVIYVYSEYKAKATLPAAHAQALIARGRWIPIVIDTSSNVESSSDGKRLSTIYENFGLELKYVKKGAGSVEQGILEVSDRLESGRLKVFSTCRGLLEEYRLYRRSDSGKIVKKDDHLMDALRYAIRDGMKVARVEPNELRDEEDRWSSQAGRSSVTGY